MARIRIKRTLSTQAHARSTDPDTSRAAAASISEDDLRKSQQAVLRILRTGEFTDTELVAVYQASMYEGEVPKQSVSGIRTRRSELVKAGLVHDTGKRVALTSGRRSIVWKAS